MIVRQAAGALYLITQPDHAALARRIMDHWTLLQDAERRPSILLAIEQHDNGWREPDAAPSIDPSTGRIYDFINAPATVRQGVWPRAVSRLSHDAWAAALVAHHAVTVYERYRTDQDWAAFFAELEETRDTFLASTALAMHQLEADYQYVRIGDLISLVFCNRWEQQGYREWTFRLDGDHIVVTPDPFGGREISIDVPAIELPDRPFGTDGELRDALRGARRVSLSGRCSG